MKSQIGTLAATAAMLLVVGGCIEAGPQAPSPQQYMGAEVQAIPENVLAAAVLVRATAYDSAYVEYQSGAGPALRTPAVGFAGDSLTRVPVLGLDTTTTYTFRVALTRTGASDEVVPLAPPDREPEWLFLGRGWGHGVGLCQWGAFGLALAGEKAPAILGRYFPGTKLERLEW